MSGLTQDPEILDEIDQIVYIADMDTYELLFVNRLGRETSSGAARNIAERKCFEVLQGLHDVCPFCRNDCLADGGETCRWDHYNENARRVFSAPGPADPLRGPQGAHRDRHRRF
jgi:two-component system sensor histidine kinase/response regulator